MTEEKKMSKENRLHMTSLCEVLQLLLWIKWSKICKMDYNCKSQEQY